MHVTPITIPVIALVVCLLIYAVGIVLMFRKDSAGLRRRWLPLDYVWVPLGGLTFISFLALWWHLH